MESTWEEVLIRNAEGNSTEAQQEQQFEEPETGEDRENLAQVKRQRRMKSASGGRQRANKYSKGAQCVYSV